MASTRRFRKSKRRGTPHTAQVLIAILATLEHFASVGDRDTKDCSVFRQHGIPYSPEKWLGRLPTVAERKRFSRAARQLEVEGSLERMTEASRDRVAFLRPTAMGLRRASRLAGQYVNMAEVVRCVGQTEWGSELSRTLEGEFDDTSIDWRLVA